MLFWLSHYLWFKLPSKANRIFASWWQSPDHYKEWHQVRYSYHLHPPSARNCGGIFKNCHQKKKILPITADHLLFVELMGQATAIPARDVKIGDTVYVRGSHGSEKDLVQSISTVYEKGAYAPVTLSGTILVNDVHTSCYFDVLSHEWSHRAMSIARALHHVSPSMMRRISAIGEKDGFPGWCRLAHTMLTLLDWWTRNLTLVIFRDAFDYISTVSVIWRVRQVGGEQNRLPCFRFSH